MTVPSAGLHLAALSSRLVTARSRLLDVADDPPRVERDVEGDARRAAAYPGHGAVDHVGEVDLARRRGSSARRGPARRGRRPAWSAPRSGRGRRRAARAAPRRAAPPLPSAWASRSRLVRSEVSGVRSSWPASATSRRCRSREAASAASIWLNAVASRAISSSPSTGSGREVLGAAISLDGRRQPAYGPQAVAGHRPAGQRRRRARRAPPKTQHHARRACSSVAVAAAPATARGPAPGRCRPARSRRGSARRRRSRACATDVGARPAATSNSGSPSVNVGHVVAGQRAGRSAVMKMIRTSAAPSIHDGTPLDGRSRTGSVTAVGLVGPVEQRLVERALHLHGASRRTPPSATSAIGDADARSWSAGRPGRPATAGSASARRRASRRRPLMIPSARSRRRARCGSAAARPRPRSCGAGSRRRPRASWRVVGKS